jgi:hypothetical protein
MSVTTAQFEAMIPVPYSKARPQLQTGDILLFHGLAAPSELIEFFTHSLWCHAAFIWNLKDIDRVLLLESVDTYGVRAVRMSNTINGCPASPKPYPGKLLVARHKLMPQPAPLELVGKMTGFAVDRLGYPYSPKELGQIALRIAAGLAGAVLPGHLEPQNAYICSEYVAKCYDAMGLDLAPDREGFIAPADIANDPNIEAILSICPDNIAA